MKVLILADVCNPKWPSLPSFSYSLAKSISENVDVVLVTHIRNKEDILQEKNSTFKEIVFIDNEYIASPAYKISSFLKKLGFGGWMTNMALKYPANLAFEYQVIKQLKQRLNNKEFDFIHRISPVSPTIPSPIAKWVDIPFIHGPINGALAWPKQFDEEIKKEREFIVHVRNIYKYFPYYKSTFNKSVKILAAFKHVEKDIPKLDLHKVIRFNELGVDTDLYKPDLEKKILSSMPCSFLFVGRLVPYKCPDLVIKAFINSQKLREHHKLNIVGDGPEREYLEKLIMDNGLDSCIKILGWKEQPEVAKFMQQSDVFVFPTIREVGGNVLLEAMASGLPSIVPDYGGPSELIDNTVGIKVPLMERSKFQGAFMQKMELLADDLNRRKQLSNNARERALNDHEWTIKGNRIKKIYESIGYPSA